MGCPGGGIGRHAGLKILWPAMAVTVQVRSGAHDNQERFTKVSLSAFKRMCTKLAHEILPEMLKNF